MRAVLHLVALLIGGPCAIAVNMGARTGPRVPEPTDWPEPDTLPAMPFDDFGNVGSEST